MCEVELELKSGPRATSTTSPPLLPQPALAARHRQQGRTRLSPRHGNPPPPVKTRPAALPADLMLDEAIARSCWADATTISPIGRPCATAKTLKPSTRCAWRCAACARRWPCSSGRSPAPNSIVPRRGQGAGHGARAGPRQRRHARMIETGPLAHFRSAKNFSADFSPLLQALEARALEAYLKARALFDSARPTVFACSSAPLSPAAAGATRWAARNCPCHRAGREFASRRWTGCTSVC